MSPNSNNQHIGKALLVLPCSGFTKTELDTIRLVLGEDRLEVSTAAVSSPCHSLEGLDIQPDHLIDSVRPSDWDAVIFLDSRVTEGYADDPSLIELARAAWAADRVIASIGAGTLVVANTGLIDDYRVVAGAEHQEYLASKGALIAQSMALRDNKLITGRDREATGMFAHLVSGALQGLEKE